MLLFPSPRFSSGFWMFVWSQFLVLNPTLETLDIRILSTTLSPFDYVSPFWASLRICTGRSSTKFTYSYCMHQGRVWKSPYNFSHLQSPGLNVVDCDNRMLFPDQLLAKVLFVFVFLALCENHKINRIWKCRQNVLLRISPWLWPLWRFSWPFYSGRVSWKTGPKSRPSSRVTRFSQFCHRIR